MSSILQATMLGKFTLCQPGMDEPRAISLVGRSRRLWTLVAYLILHQDRGVSAQELIELLWPDEEKSNPASTLQNNVSRARNALGELGFENPKALIAYTDGYYKWALDCETQLDAHQFEEQAKAALAREDRESAITQAKSAIALYTGDFLPDAATELWCINLNVYYRSLYIRLCRETVQWLFQAGRVDEARQICAAVVHIDPAAEEFSVYLMQALTRSGQAQKALEHYEYIWQLYRDTYGVAPTAALEAEKSAAVQELYGGDIQDAEIRQFLLGDDEEGGAFCCDNNVFREIVSLHVRAMRRSKSQAQIAIIRLEQRDVDQEQRAIYMRQMETTLQRSLRAGDPFTRVGAGQFWVLLPGATTSNGEMVMERIMDRLRKGFPRSPARFTSRVLDLRELGDRIGLDRA